MQHLYQLFSSPDLYLVSVGKVVNTVKIVLFFTDVPEFTVVVEKKTEPLVEKEDSNSTSLIKPPLPVFKNISNNSTSASNKATVLSNVFSSRGARLLKMSKEKISSSPSFSSQDSPPTNSYR